MHTSNSVRLVRWRIDAKIYHTLFISCQKLNAPAVFFNAFMIS